MVCQEPTSTPTGMSRPRPFADEQRGHRGAVEGVGADAVHGVRRHDNQPAALERPYRRGDSARTLVGIGAVEHVSHRRSLLASRHEPRPAGQILARRRIVFEKSCGSDQFDGPRRRGVVVLDGEQATRAQPAPGEADNGGDHAIPSGAAEHRVRRIMLGHFGFQHDIVGNVGRVGDDQVDLSVKFGEAGRRSR